MNGLIRNAIDDLVHEHGPDIVAEALQQLPRVIALIKAGKARRVRTLLDEAHRDVDEMARTMRPTNAGEGHE